MGGPQKCSAHAKVCVHPLSFKPVILEGQRMTLFYYPNPDEPPAVLLAATSRKGMFAGSAQEGVTLLNTNLNRGCKERLSVHVHYL